MPHLKSKEFDALIESLKAPVAECMNADDADLSASFKTLLENTLSEDRDPKLSSSQKYTIELTLKEAEIREKFDRAKKIPDETERNAALEAVKAELNTYMADPDGIFSKAEKKSDKLEQQSSVYNRFVKLTDGLTNLYKLRNEISEAIPEPKPEPVVAAPEVVEVKPEPVIPKAPPVTPEPEPVIPEAKPMPKLEPQSQAQPPIQTVAKKSDSYPYLDFIATILKAAIKTTITVIAKLINATTSAIETLLKSKDKKSTSEPASSENGLASNFSKVISDLNANAQTTQPDNTKQNSQTFMFDSAPASAPTAIPAKPEPRSPALVVENEEKTKVLPKRQ